MRFPHLLYFHEKKLMCYLLRVITWKFALRKWIIVVWHLVKLSTIFIIPKQVNIPVMHVTINEFSLKVKLSFFVFKGIDHIPVCILYSTMVHVRWKMPLVLNDYSHMSHCVICYVRISPFQNIFLKCQDMADKQRHKLHRKSQLADGLLNPDNLLEVPIQIVELQRERALEDLPEIKQVRLWHHD